MKLNECPYHLTIPHLHNNLLFELLLEPDFSQALVYLVAFKKYKNLNVVAKEHCIEISNSEITVAVIIYSGFETNEYLALKKRENLHLITFSSTIPNMIEFRKLNIKLIDKLAWMFRILEESKSAKNKKINSIRKLPIDA